MTSLGSDRHRLVVIPAKTEMTSDDFTVPLKSG